MKVTAERIEDCQVVLNVEVEPEAVERSMDKAYRKLVTRANIPGFRRGKAPRSMVERFFGRQALLEQALEELVPSAYDEAVKQENLEPIAQAKLEVVQMEPLSFKATVPLRPTVELGPYQKIRIASDLAVVTDEEIEEALKSLRERKAVWTDVERPVRFGDQVVMDLDGTVQGETFSNPGIPYVVEQDNQVPVPGFAEKLIDAEAGSTVAVDLQFPEDHSDQRLAGKAFHYEATIRQIKERVVPELTDELAHELDPDLNTVDDLRQRVAENLKAMAELKVREKLEREVVDAAVASARVEFPPVLMEQEMEDLADEVLSRAGGPQKLTLEQYLRFTGRTEEQFREEIGEVARRRIRTNLILDEIATVEAVAASDEEVDVEIQNLLGRSLEAQAEGNAKALAELSKSAAFRDSIRHGLVRRKTTNRLIEIATGDTRGTPQEVATTTGDAEDQSEGTSESRVSSAESDDLEAASEPHQG